MILRDKIIFWILGIAAFFYFLNSISSILFPFITAVMVAYFLDPLVNKLQKFKLSRPICALIISGFFVAIIAVICLVILPSIYRESVNFINLVPGYFEVFIKETYPSIVNFLQAKGYRINSDFAGYLNEENLPKILSFFQDILKNIMKSSVSIINIFSLIFIIPILVFYLLKDWHLLVGNINGYLPSKYALKIRKIFGEIDKTLSGYLRGQLNVCLILGGIYAVGLGIVGLNFGILIGFFTGIMAFVPYVGMVIGVIMALIVALFQWGIDFTQLWSLAIVFLIGQIIESNFLTPKLVGKKIGLHPVWVIFAIFVFGILFGFVGVLFSVPLAAICGVIIKFIAHEYKDSFVKDQNNS